MKKFLVLTLVTLVLLGLIGCAAYAQPAETNAPAEPNAPAPAPLNIPPVSNAVPPSELESAFENIYAQVSPSVVAIEVVQQAARQNLPTLGQQQAVRGLGSGFIWDGQGNIVTNNHVVEGATQIAVVFTDGTILQGKVTATDPDSDLAIVKVNVSANQLRPVQMADSNQLRVGQLAIAIGNPFGEQSTMTTGIISALERQVPAGESTTRGPVYTIPDVIQTDAPINPGNSGGVLLNMQGQVVGVTFAIESPNGTSAGIGFAIPSAIVQKVVPSLIKNGRYDHPYLGVGGASLTPAIAQQTNLKPEQRGALIASITPGSPAAKAGLRGGSQQTTQDGIGVTLGGDVITAVDGQPVKTFGDMVGFLSRAQVNQTIALTILRDGKTQTVQVKLEPRPSQQRSP